MAEIANPGVPHTDRKEAYLRERWVLTSAEAWERPSATAASHWSLAVLRCDHWLRTLRCATGLHSLSDDEGDGDGEAAAGWGGRVGVAAEVSIDSKGFLRCFVCWPAARLDLDSAEARQGSKARARLE